jgi:hypothetical protein
MFGDKAKLDPIDHLLGTAYGWGGPPQNAQGFMEPNALVELRRAHVPAPQAGCRRILEVPGRSVRAGRPG